MNQGQPIVEYFLHVAEACGDGKAAANWVTQDVLRLLKERDITIDVIPIGSSALADLIKKVRAGEIPSPRLAKFFRGWPTRASMRPRP